MIFRDFFRRSCVFLHKIKRISLFCLTFAFISVIVYTVILYYRVLIYISPGVIRLKVMQILKTSVGALWAYRQIRCLTQLGVDVVVVLPNDTEAMAVRYKDLPVTIETADLTLPLSRPWLLKSRIQTLRALVDKHKPDLIHFHFVSNILLGRLALKKVDIPRVFQVPGPLHLENPITRCAELILSDKKDYWIGSCRKTCNIYKKYHIPSHHLFLSFYGGDVEEITARAAKCDGRLRNEFQIPKTAEVVGMVCYFYKPKYHMLQFRGLKGHEDFIDAFALLKKERPELYGIIVGGPWGNAEKYFEKMKKYAQRKVGNSLIFTGFRSDIYEIYPELDVVAHPSLSENLGGAAESLLIGVPTVTTNIGGFPDIVIDGETGYTVPAKNPKALADAMLRLLKDKEKTKQMAENGVKLMTKVIDVNNTAKEVFHIYEAVLSDFSPNESEAKA